MNAKYHDFSGLFLVICSQPIQDFENQLHQRLSRLRMMNVRNLHLVFPMEGSQDLLLTVSDALNCTSFRLNFITLLSSDGFNSDRGGTGLFEPSRDFNQCLFTVSVVKSEPFVIVNQSTPVWTVSGIDVKIVELLSSRLNFRYRFVHPPDHEAGGTIYPNGTVTGALGMVSHDT